MVAGWQQKALMQAYGGGSYHMQYVQHSTGVHQHNSNSTHKHGKLFLADRDGCGHEAMWQMLSQRMRPLDW
jgi:hypothetical protein